jgi:hypothetical protein
MADNISITIDTRQAEVRVKELEAKIRELGVTAEATGRKVDEIGDIKPGQARRNVADTRIAEEDRLGKLQQEARKRNNEALAKLDQQAAKAKIKADTELYQQSLPFSQMQQVGKKPLTVDQMTENILNRRVFTGGATSASVGYDAKKAADNVRRILSAEGAPKVKDSLDDDIDAYKVFLSQKSAVDRALDELEEKKAANTAAKANNYAAIQKKANDERLARQQSYYASEKGQWDREQAEVENHYRNMASASAYYDSKQGLAQREIAEAENRWRSVSRSAPSRQADLLSYAERGATLPPTDPNSLQQAPLTAAMSKAAKKQIETNAAAINTGTLQAVEEAIASNNGSTFYGPRITQSMRKSRALQMAAAEFIGPPRADDYTAYGAGGVGGGSASGGGTSGGGNNKFPWGGSVPPGSMPIPSEPKAARELAGELASIDRINAGARSAATQMLLFEGQTISAERNIWGRQTKEAIEKNKIVSELRNDEYLSAEGHVKRMSSLRSAEDNLATTRLSREQLQLKQDAGVANAQQSLWKQQSQSEIERHKTVTQLQDEDYLSLEGATRRKAALQAAEDKLAVTRLGQGDLQLKQDAGLVNARRTMWGQQTEAAVKNHKTVTELQDQDYLSRAGHIRRTAAQQAAEDKLAVKRLDQEKLQLLQDAKIKQAQKTMEGGGILQSKFGTWSILMSGLAATLFVWQQVLTTITSIVSAGNDYDQTLRKIGATGNLSAKGLQMMDESMRDMIKDGIDTKQISSAFAALKERGMSTADAMKGLATTAELARYGFVSLKSAAEMVDRGDKGMIRYVLEMNEAMKGGASESWDKFAGRMKLIAADFFRREEPVFMNTLTNLSTWMDANSGVVVDNLGRLAEAMINLSNSFLWIVENGAKVVDFFANLKVPNGFGQYNKEYNPQEAQEMGDILERDMKNADSKWDRFWRNLTERRKDPFNTESSEPAWRPPYITDPKAQERNERQWSASDRSDYSGVTWRSDQWTNEQKRPFWNQMATAMGLYPAQMQADKRTAIGESVRGMRMSGIEPGMVKEFEETETWKIQQQSISKEMETLKKLFETTGATREKYWENEIDNIKFRLKQDVDAKRLTQAEADKEQVMEEWGVRMRREAPKIAIHENIFQETGKMTEYLKNQKIDALQHALDKVKNMPQGLYYQHDVAEAQKRYDIGRIKLDREENAPRLEAMKKFYSEAGMLEQDYRIAAGKDIEAEVEIQARKWKLTIAQQQEYGEELRRRLEDDVTNPMLSAWGEYHTSLGKMSDEEFKLIADKNRRQAERLQKIIGPERSSEWLKRATTLNEASWSRGRNNPFNGIIAGMKELEAESKPIASEIADEWKSAANDIHQGFKDGFFDLMSADFTKLQDTIQNILQRIQRMFSDMLFDMMTKDIRNQINGSSGQGLMGMIFKKFGFDVDQTPNPGAGYVGGDMKGEWGSDYGWQPKTGPMDAKGGVYDQFGMVRFGRGGIVRRPTVFPFARGTGLMGEAGPEAIMPLSRGPGGVLGVRAEGTGGAGTTSVVVHNYSGQQVSTRESNSGGMDKRMIEVMVGNAIASGGPASKAFEATYGLRRSGR